MPDKITLVNLDDLGKRLVAHRRRLRMSQGRLARSAVVDVTVISRLERGMSRALSLETFCRLAHGLRTTPNDLLGWED